MQICVLYITLVPNNTRVIEKCRNAIIVSRCGNNTNISLVKIISVKEGWRKRHTIRIDTLYMYVE